jgi:hypothetical protein
VANIKIRALAETRTPVRSITVTSLTGDSFYGSKAATAWIWQHSSICCRRLECEKLNVHAPYTSFSTGGPQVVPKVSATWNDSTFLFFRSYWCKILSAYIYIYIYIYIYTYTYIATTRESKYDYNFYLYFSLSILYLIKCMKILGTVPESCEKSTGSAESIKIMRGQRHRKLWEMRHKFKYNTWLQGKIKMHNLVQVRPTRTPTTEEIRREFVFSQIYINSYKKSLNIFCESHKICCVKFRTAKIGNRLHHC